MISPTLTNIAHAVPKTVLHQDEVIKVVEGLYPDHPEIKKFIPVFKNTEIETRYTCVPIDWFFSNHGWQERMEVYQREAVNLLHECVVKVLDDAKLKPSEIDAVVTVSTSGISTPSLEAFLMDRLEFSPWLKRTPVWGWGCAGGLLGLIRASEIAEGRGGQRVLLLASELCTLCFRRNEFNSKDLISTALFGDGAAAAVIQPAEKGWRVEHAGEYRWPDSLSLMGWDFKDDGPSVIFSKKIPQMVANEYPKVLDEFLKRHRLTLQDIDHFLAHPGGAKIIEALEEVYKLHPGQMRETRDILKNFGNMSSPTVLFVLEQFLNEKQKSDRTLVTTFGPGFTCGIATMRNVH